MTAAGKAQRRTAARRLPAAAAAALALPLLIAERPVTAAIRTVGPGESLVLDQDLVLEKGDELAAEGTPAAPCLIEGQGHGIRTVEGWEGRFRLRHCNIHALGTADVDAVRVQAVAAAETVIEGNTFDESGRVWVTSLDMATIRVVGNTVLATSVVPVLMNSAERTIDAMLFDGFANTTEKVFQGNRILRSRAQFTGTQNWLIGGVEPGQGNIFAGTRGGMSISGVTFRIVGNYIRSTGDLVGWNQVKPLQIFAADVIVEHNVIRDGNWLVDIGGDVELRYNVLGDSHDRPWLLLENFDGTHRVHHNVFMRNDPRNLVDGLRVYRPDSALPAEIYNNTFYGGGKCWRASGPAVIVEPGGFLDSLRSNAIVGFATNLGTATAMVRGAGLERFVESPKPGEPLYEPNDPAPERLGYTDYNLFYNPGAERRGNYGLAVAGKQERLDPGFALNDAPAGGSIDDQVDPRFAAGDKIPVAFPYADEDIIAGTTTVCQILRFYRSLFAPGPGSPLAGAGDPADGAGNNIGAVGNGGPEDRLGTLCPGDDVGAPALGPPAYVCPKLPPSRTAPLGGASSERTLVCVCEQASAPPAPGLAAAVALGAALLAARTRRRSSCARRRP